MVNKAKLKETWNYIKNNPEDYAQHHWLRVNCGTKGCFAFHRARQSGAKVLPLTEDEKEELQRNGEIFVAHMAVDGHKVSISEFATAELDLTADQAYSLFYYRNTLDDMRIIVSCLLDDRPIPDRLWANAYGRLLGSPSW